MIAKVLSIICVGIIWFGAIGCYLWAHAVNGLWSFLFGGFLVFLLMVIAVADEPK